MVVGTLITGALSVAAAVSHIADYLSHGAVHALSQGSLKKSLSAWGILLVTVQNAWVFLPHVVVRNLRTPPRAAPGSAPTSAYFHDPSEKTTKDLLLIALWGLSLLAHLFWLWDHMLASTLSALAPPFHPSLPPPHASLTRNRAGDDEHTREQTGP